MAGIAPASAKTQDKRFTSLARLPTQPALNRTEILAGMTPEV